ncbi:hypothetical protein AOLI_G00111440 [Acnodon oligacanthus]
MVDLSINGVKKEDVGIYFCGKGKTNTLEHLSGTLLLFAGFIYIHPHTSDECEKSSETDSPTQSCVCKIPKRNLSLSDAGTYYCAVAACGDEAESTEEGDVFTVWFFIVKVVALAGLFVTQAVLHIFITFTQK